MVKQISPKISYIDYGIGFCVQDGKKRYIELNKNLKKKKYKKLRKQVLAHELLHFNSPNNHLDFMIDFKDLFNIKKNWNLFKFGLSNPRTHIASLPFMYDKQERKWCANWFMVIFNAILVSLIVGGIYLI